MDFLEVCELVGVAAFAASGAITAIEKKLDVFGIVVLAFLTAVGGGVLRDVIMDRGVPVFFSNYRYTAIILATSVVMMLLRDRVRWSFPFVVIDTLGLAVFTVVAGVKAIDSGMNLLAFLFVSVITGVGGSVLRDIIVQEVPTILRKEIYATAVLIGALVLWFTLPYLGRTLSVYLCIFLVFAIRMVSYRLNVNLSFVKEG